MNKLVSRQKRKIILSVVSVLFCAWIVVSALFFFVVLKLELDACISEEKFAENRLLASLEDGLEENLLIHTNSVGNNRYSKGDGSLKDFQLVIFKSGEDDVYFNTAASVCERFYGLVNAVDVAYYGIIDFESFRNSITDSQYGIIREYLTKEPEASGEQYWLVATRFYYDEENSRLIPKVVEIVLADENNTWYRSAGVKESFELAPENVEGLELYKMDNDRFNDIPAEFVLNGLSAGNLIDSAENPIPSVSDEDTHNVEQVSLFEYVYSNVSELNTLNSGYGYYYRSDNLYFVRYIRHIDISGGCRDFLILGLSSIFVFFTVLGVILASLLIKMQKAQEQENQKRREITNALAHDIKTPVFIISGYAQNLKENLNTEKREHYADRIIERTREVDSIVHKMLDFAAIDSTDYIRVDEKVDLSATVRYLLEDYKVLDNNRHIETRIRCDVFINADKVLITRALSNLIENAVRYSETDSTIKVTLDSEKFSISNVTRSVTPEDVGNLTKPYFRVEKNRLSKGNGLGLSVVKSVCDTHDFELDIRLTDEIITFDILF